MRHEFGELLFEHAKKNKDIVLCTFDMGYGLWDKFRDELPDQFFNLGISEQAGTGVAVGLALSGKIPFCYSITPFLLWRPAEVIRLYINHEQLPIKLIASGRNKDYETDGFSHDATDAKKFLDQFKNITQYWPEEKEELPNIIEEIINNDKPCFVSLRR